MRAQEEEVKDDEKLGDFSPDGSGAEIPGRLQKFSNDTLEGCLHVIPTGSDRTEDERIQEDMSSSLALGTTKKLSFQDVEGSIVQKDAWGADAARDPVLHGHQVASAACVAPPADFVMTDWRSGPSSEKSVALDGMEGISLKDCSAKIFQFFLEVVSLRSQSMGKGNSKAVFPLPTSREHLLGIFPDLAGVELEWLLCVVTSLNSYWGGDVFCDLPPNEIQLKCLRGLVCDVQRLCNLDVTLPSLTWDDFFRVKAIDYKGDEVQVVHMG